MRAVIAMMQHETNTFSPVPTPLERFAVGNDKPVPFEGEAAIAEFRDTGTALGAFIDLADKEGAELVCPIAASAWPSGPVEDAAYDYMTQKICDAVAQGCDVILLHLHGAMVTESLDDGEGPLLQRLRALAPDTPIGVALDMHTNLYPAIVENADVVAGYQTYPHIDIYETGIRVGASTLAMAKGITKPTMAWGNRPMLPHIMRQGTADFPNRDIQALAQKMEKDGALAATFFTGFPHADIELAGSSAIVVTDNDQAGAEKLCRQILDMAWENRQAFVYEVEPLEQSLARAAELATDAQDGPVVLLDHYDNAASGGSMDTMNVLRAIIDAGLEDVAAFAICDREAVATLIEAGVGQQATITLGGKADMPSIGEIGVPLEVTGRVKLIADGRFRNICAMNRGALMDMGPTVVFDTGKVEIVIISEHVEPHDLNCFLSLGIDPQRKKYVMLKSRIHWRAGLADLASATVECAGVGVCTSDYSTLNFNKLRRPIYPLDQDLQPYSKTVLEG